MPLNSVSPEPDLLIHIRADNADVDKFTPLPSFSSCFQDYTLGGESLPIITCHHEQREVSKYPLSLVAIIVALVILLHGLLFWWLAYHPEITVDHHSSSISHTKHDENIFHVSMVAPPQPKVNMAGASQAAKSIAAARARRVQQTSHQQSKGRSASVSTHSRKASSSKTTPRVHHHRRDTSTRREGEQPRKLPSAQHLIQQVVSQASSDGWRRTAQAYAQGSPNNSEQNAIDRYLAYFTQTVQTYIDLNLSTENIADTRMSLSIAIDRSGHLLSVRVSKSSGYQTLDQLAVKTIYEAGPYRPFDFAMGNIPELRFSRNWIFGHGSPFHFQ